MVILDSTTKTIQILLSGLVVTSQLPIVASYADSELPAYASFADLRLSQETQATNQTITADTTVVTAVAAPGSGDQRRLKYLSVYNADTAEVTPTVRLNDNGTTRILAKPTLAVGDTLYYVEGIGFYVMDTNGAMKSAGTIPFATPSIVFGTAAAAGIGTSTIRSDATIVAFDTTVPVTQAFGDVAATGSVAFASRRDHTHGMPATPVTTLAGTAAEITASASTGAITLSLPTAITLTSKTMTGGTFNSPTIDSLLATTFLKLTAGIDIRPSADSTTAINFAQADGTDWLVLDTTNMQLGIGGTPAGHLDILKTTPSIRFTNTGSGNKVWRIEGQTNNWAISESGISTAMLFTAKIAGASSAHISFGAASAPTGGGGPVLVMENQGGGPTSIGANTAGIYVADVAGTTELFGFDEAGNTPQLTPHPASFLATMPVKAIGPYAYPWAYHAINKVLGRRIEVDMAGVVEAVEQLAGKSFTVVTALPASEIEDWDANQENHRLLRIEKQKAWDTAETQDGPRPKDYIKKRPAKWLVDRGVKTAIVEA